MLVSIYSLIYYQNTVDIIRGTNSKSTPPTFLNLPHTNKTIFFRKMTFSRKIQNIFFVSLDNNNQCTECAKFSCFCSLWRGAVSTFFLFTERGVISLFLYLKFMFFLLYMRERHYFQDQKSDLYLIRRLNEISKIESNGKQFVKNIIILMTGWTIYY